VASRGKIKDGQASMAKQDTWRSNDATVIRATVRQQIQRCTKTLDIRRLVPTKPTKNAAHQ
jgi:hypothetical protein